MFSLICCSGKIHELKWILWDKTFTAIPYDKLVFRRPFSRTSPVCEAVLANLPARREAHTHNKDRPRRIIRYSSELTHFFSSSSGLDTGFKTATSNAISIDDHQT